MRAYDPAKGLVHHRIILDEEFRHLVPAHAPAERETLEKQILADRRCLCALVIWKETRILLDGYTQFDICTRHDIAFWVVEMSFASREAPRAWIPAHQTGQRTLNANGLSYIRGLRYLLEKHGERGPSVRFSPNHVRLAFAAGPAEAGAHAVKEIPPSASFAWSGY